MKYVVRCTQLCRVTVVYLNFALLLEGVESQCVDIVSCIKYCMDALVADR